MIDNAGIATAAPPEPSPARGRGSWRAGTLTYTTAGLVVLFCWLLWGDFAYYIKERSVTPTFTLLLRKFQAPDVVVGALIGFLPQALALILVPVVSYRSDRHRGRWGRRIPFLLLPTPIILVSMLGLAYGPIMGQWLHHATSGALSESAAVILTLGFAWTVYEICITVCNSVFHGLFNDVVPREVLGRFWALFRMVTLIDGVVFNYFIIGHAESHYALIFSSIGIFYAISFTLMCLNVKEGEYPPVPPAESGRPDLAVKTYFRDCFTQPYYLWFFTHYALVRWAVQPLALFMLFYAKSVKLDMAAYGKYAALQMVVSLVMAYPTGWLVDRFHAIRVSMGALVIYTVVTLLAYFLVHDATTLGMAIVGCGASAGIATTALQPLSLALLPKAKFAQFNSASSIGSSLGLMIISPLCGWAFDHFGKEYRYVYLFASVGTFLSLVTLLPVYRTVMARGGLKNYVAP